MHVAYMSRFSMPLIAIMLAGGYKRDTMASPSSSTVALQRSYQALPGDRRAVFHDGFLPMIVEGDNGAISAGYVSKADLTFYSLGDGYVKAGPFENGRAAVVYADENGRSTRIIDTHFKTIATLPLGVEVFEEFDGGLSFAWRQNASGDIEYAVVNLNREEIIASPFSTRVLSPFHDGLSLSGTDYIDGNGNVAISLSQTIDPRKFPRVIASPFFEGLAKVSLYGATQDPPYQDYYMDKTGKIVIQTVNVQVDGKAQDYYIYNASRFSEGISFVILQPQYNARWEKTIPAFIDSKGHVLYQTGLSSTYHPIVDQDQIERIDATGGGGVAIGEQDNTGQNRDRIFNRDKNKILPQDEIFATLKSGLIRQYKSSYSPILQEFTGFADKQGRMIIRANPLWKKARGFSDGMAAVQANDKWGFIDTNGEIVIDYQFDEVAPFAEGVALATKYSQQGSPRYFVLNKAGLVREIAIP